jgi:hypothetical protein
MKKNVITIFRIATVLTGAIVLSACSTTKPTAAGAIESPKTAGTISSAESEKSKSPAAADVQAAIQRVYLNAVEIDPGPRESFLIGDFNGDGSQDLAVVQPVEGALTKLNSDYANWIVEDPQKIVLPKAEKAVQKLPPPPARERFKLTTCCCWYCMVIASRVGIIKMPGRLFC